MKPFLMTILIGAGLGFASAAQAQAPAATPITATCKDGSSFSGKSRSGACRGHGGVQAFNSVAAPAGAAPMAAAPMAAAPAASAPAATGTTPDAAAPPAATAAAKPARRARATPTPQKAQAPGGGPGLVWVNSASKVYHCSTDRYYGRTKAGEYMTEDAAKAAGDKGVRGKTCS